jgi:outer membrane lipoprotein-sorting protein
MRATVVAALAASFLGAAPAAPAQTRDEVIARYLKARGGIERIRAVKTLRLSGKIVLPDVESPLVLELKRPNRMRTEFALEGKPAVRAFDGQTAWMVLPLPGLDEPKAMPPEEAKEAQEQADIDLSPLVDHEAKGFKVELLGRETVDGREVFKLVVRSADGHPRTLFIDAKTSLVVRAEEHRPHEGKDELFETVLGDYQSTSGLVFPHLIEVGPKGRNERQRIVFDKIEVNPPVDDSRFAMPPAR